VQRRVPARLESGLQERVPDWTAPVTVEIAAGGRDVDVKATPAEMASAVWLEVDAAPLNATTVADQMSATLRVAVALVVRAVAATRSPDSTQLANA
jgi:hypothetical protein